MNTIEHEYDEFRRLMAEQVADLRATMPEEYLDRYWMFRGSTSRESFLKEFPTPTARREALRIARQVGKLQAAVFQELENALDRLA